MLSEIDCYTALYGELILCVPHYLAKGILITEIIRLIKE